MRELLHTCLMFIALLGMSATQAQTIPGTTISNTAQIDFVRQGTGVTDSVTTNTVSTTVVPLPTTSTVSILRFTDTASATQNSTAGPTQCFSNGSFTNLAAPTFSNGSTINAAQLLALAKTDIVHDGDAVFLQVQDADQNRNATQIDTLDLVVSSETGDQETIRLSETGVNTGVFVGYIQSRSSATAVRGDCVLQADRDSRITATYTDQYNNADTSQASVLVDPYGVVFDSQTGQAVNGVRVRLVNAVTGATATVLGDDGVSSYPAEVTTGNAVTDSGGTVYNLPAGMFRFPLVALGQYRFEITTPNGYSFASGRSIAELNQLGTVHRLSTASFGATFTTTSPAAIAVDVPVDPAGTQLYMTKSTTTTIAAQGDFVQYTLGVQNVSSSVQVPNVVVTDVLPPGLRYQKSSARLNTQRVADPTISNDGRTLTFNIGTLASSAMATLRYVVEVTVAAHGDKLTNSAHAANTLGAASNTAQATIQLHNELFNDQGFIVGRVITGTCDQDGTSSPGVVGVKVYLEDGRYAVTDKEGKYHFEGVPAGSHVVQMDTVTVPDTLEPQLCDARARHAGRAYSQFVDLRAGALWRADFVLKPKAPPQGTMHFGMVSAIAGDTELLHTVTAQVDALPVSNIKIMVMLPEGIDYLAGSTQLDQQAIADPQNMDGTLIFRMAEWAAGTSTKLNFKTRLKTDEAGGFAVKAVLLFDTPAQKNQRSELIENQAARGQMNYETASYRFSPHFDVMGTALSAADRLQLDKLAEQWRGVKNIHIRAVGHTDKHSIAKTNATQFTDNYALSKARAQVVAEYLRTALKLDNAQIAVDGKGADEPIATGDSPSSLAKNRRVDIDIEGVRIKEVGKVTLITSHADAATLTTVGVVRSSKTLTATKHVNSSPVAADIDVETLQPGIAMVSPASGDIPAISSVKIAVQHAADQNVELRLNGVPVSALNFDGVTTKSDKRVALTRWRGVDIKDGDNELVAIVRDADNHEVQRITRTVHFSGGAVRAEYVQAQSILSADGSTHPIVAVRMYDAAGQAARPGTMGVFNVETPYRAWSEVQSMQDQQLSALAPRDPQFVVDDDGLARIELEPTAQSGMAVIHLRFNERQSQDIRVWLEPQARDWVLVGIAEGTATYNSITQHAEAAAAADDIKQSYSDDGRVAFFAKGRIKGDYLLTLAYDSRRNASIDKQSLLGVIDPHQYYSLYGDGSEQRFESPSSRKLYIKLERHQFMAMFGDFNTGLTVTELSRYSRTLTGVKSEYAGEHYGYNAFAANTDQGYVQDELQGDGTSGLYKLTQQNIIANTDQLRIEVRDRIRTELVIDTHTLTRYIDYDIDYLNGTIFFKQPVMSRDENFNPQFIIVDYEILSGMKNSVTAGGRGYARFGNTEIGATAVNEGAAAGDTRLGGLDARIKFNDTTNLRAEVARTHSDNPAKTTEANAWFTELKHVSQHIDASAYFRVQENGYGFGQQLSTEMGSRKVGVDAHIKVNDHWAMKIEALNQQLMATDAERNLASVQVTHTTQRVTAGGGLRYVGDRNVSVGDVHSEQAFLNGSIKLLDQRMTLRAEQDVSLSGSSAVSDFPARSLIGVDYLLNKSATLFADYEHASGTNLNADMTRIGMRATPWQRAQLSSSMNQQFTENGTRTFANLGLTQGWQINDRWAMDFGVDQSKTVHGNSSYTFNQNAPPASGTISSSNSSATKWQTGDYLALSVASLYRTELWSITDRVEHRHGDTEDRWTVLSGFYREAIKGHAFAFVTQYLDSNSKTAGDNVNASLQLSWAYRPVDSRWIVLDRVDLKHQRSDGSAQLLQSSRLVNNAHVNVQISNHTQLGIQMGLRYVITSFDGDKYAGASGLLGVDYRHDLNNTFDVGIHGAALRSFKSGVGNASLGADIGITVMKNAWVSVGYNVQGVNDRDFDDSHYLAQGPYLKFRIKFDQDTFKDLNLAGLRGKGN